MENIRNLRAQRTSERNAFGFVIVPVFDRNDLVRRVAVLNPVNHGQQHIMLLVKRERLCAAAKHVLPLPGASKAVRSRPSSAVSHSRNCRAISGVRCGQWKRKKNTFANKGKKETTRWRTDKSSERVVQIVRVAQRFVDLLPVVQCGAGRDASVSQTDVREELAVLEERLNVRVGGGRLAWVSVDANFVQPLNLGLVQRRKLIVRVCLIQNLKDRKSGE